MTPTTSASAHDVSRAPIWTPSPDAVEASRIDRFAGYVAQRTGSPIETYLDLWALSVEQTDEFWTAVSEFFALIVDGEPECTVVGAMPETRWFPGLRVNYAEHALRHHGSGTAVISIDEGGTTQEMSWDDLRAQVGSVARFLREQGVTRGDRVVGYLPNSAHAVVAFLATVSLGALWSACGPDYGAAGAAARFAQLDPVVLFAADGYTWHGRPHDRRSEVAALQDLLPTVRATVHVPILSNALATAGAHAWADLLARPAPVQFERVDFNDPLWVLYSSGTTGTPKGIVHSHGGVLLEHHKLLGLHHDLGPGDRFFWYTTTNWMMWNLVVSGLLLGSTIVVYDGSPTYPNPQRLWTIAANCRARVLGVSPGYLLSCAKAGVEPARDLDLQHLEILGSTGAPLAEQQYDWVHDHVGSTIQVASVSGGTDVVSGFAGSAPNTAVWAGELSAPMLGVALEARDENGRPVVGDVGELVITEPMPSMPVFFWNDPDGTRYRTSYFETYPGLWRHGDWVIVTDRGSVLVTGRSDATLNRHGVRLGSADIYDVVEDLPEVGEALVVGIELDGGGYWMPLFVVPAPGRSLDDELRERITTAIRTHASPRHVPDEIIEVPAIPHTRTGKKIEIPIKRIVQGADVDRIIGSDTIDDLDALRYFTRFTRPDAASRTP
ncbi:acetoacetate--CoA ligase [Rhodococcus erythropolis]|uniref:acetoacetate--CoA ligase n=1 Tax=Rhodococcus erythropolis TaxID=1833 RepID=UPI00197F5967|nr:acetoacetate--CoA ligase [Rhodococcus erythropolis]QSE41309.1 acetoacetate--CoA ligase [Rhodococcus erythropolis]